MSEMYKYKMEHKCFFFQHPYVHDAPGHKHVCLHEDNPTLRCGYDADEWDTCPLSAPESSEEHYNKRDESNELEQNNTKYKGKQ